MGNNKDVFQIQGKAVPLFSRLSVSRRHSFLGFWLWIGEVEINLVEILDVKTTFAPVLQSLIHPDFHHLTLNTRPHFSFLKSQKERKIQRD